MKKSINQDGVISGLMGTEHELSISFGKRPSINDFTIEEINNTPYDNLKEIDNFNESSVNSFYEGMTKEVLSEVNFPIPSLKLLNNGGAMSFYPARPLEIATPECLSPRQLVAYSLASRLLIKQCLSEYLSENSDNVRFIALNERVVDSHGNSWGEHDNFSLLPEESGCGVVPGYTPPLIWTHLLTRGSITGAGRVSNSDNKTWSMSQKLGTVTSINDKKWGSSAIYGDDERLEIRCSDKNVSEWSHFVRIGSMALVLALTRTGFTEEDLGIELLDLYNPKKIQPYDSLIVSPSGDVKFSSEAKISIIVQRILAEASLEMLDQYDNSASEYKFIAKCWLAFAEKLEKASQSGEPLDLSNFVETDWAAKFYTIQSRILQDKNNGISREPFDSRTQAQDILYDRILFDCPVAGEKVYEIEGTGFKFNNRIHTRKITNQKDISHALANPPLYSRAETRTKFISILNEIGCTVSSFNWSSISWIDSDYEKRERFF